MGRELLGDAVWRERLGPGCLRGLVLRLGPGVCPLKVAPPQRRFGDGGVGLVVPNVLVGYRFGTSARLFWIRTSAVALSMLPACVGWGGVCSLAPGVFPPVDALLSPR